MTCTNTCKMSLPNCNHIHTFIPLQCRAPAPVRIDSSPQYGRDFLMAELDVLYTNNVTAWADIGPQQLITRLLPGQTLGARSSGLAHKTRKLVHMLALESERLNVTLTRCCSILSDWGVEAGIWRVPADIVADLQRECNYDTLFGLSLFLPDGDHSLHHVLGLNSVFMLLLLFIHCHESCH